MDQPFGRAGPLFERRAYMLDISRDRVPTNETLEWIVGVLQALRFNELQLYVEHTFAYAGHDVVWRNASPMTHDEMRWLDKVCEAHGIDLVANMNCFGHMGRWFEHDDYLAMAECPGGAPAIFGEGLTGPGCLAATPANAEFGVGLARDMASVVRHARIHIGGDEPFELGEGASAAAVAERGRDRVYLEHLSRIIEPLVGDGHEVMFWADLFRRDATLMPMIPHGSTGVVWNYEAPGAASWQEWLPAEVLARLGIPDDANLGFESHARLFIESDTPFWVAPGTASWCTVIGRNLNAAANIADAVAVGSAHGSPGLLLADWGDNGHWQPPTVSLPSMVRAGVAAWSGEVPDAITVAGIVDDVLGSEPGVGAVVDRLGGIGEGLGLACLNSTPIFGALSTGGFPAIGDLDPDGHARAVAVLEEAAEVFAAETVGGERGATVSAEMSAAVGLATVGLGRLAAEHLSAGEPSGVELETAVEAQRAAWLLSSRPGGLDDSLAKLRR